MKRRFFICALLLLALGCMTVRAGALVAQRADDTRIHSSMNEARLSVPVEDYVRLHVLAEDDSEAAQALKLKVRDAVLAEARALLADCPDADAAWRIVNEDVEALEIAASACAQEEGYMGPVTAETGVFEFPDRQYDGVTVPAGEYRALRVVIGEGQGHNWWCVLYPSLCLDDDCVPGEPVAFHSTILNWLRRWLGGDGA